MKQILLSSLVVGMGVAFLYLFWHIHRYGEFWWQEPSLIILWVETVFVAVITGFGLLCFMWQLRGK